MQLSDIDESERTPCEIWSRVMGYHRPVSTWNVGKQQEHRDRVAFVECDEHMFGEPPTDNTGIL